MRGRAATLLPLLLVAVVLMMVIPIPTALLDVLLAANFAVGIVVLLTVLLLKDSLQFSVFPSLLLVATLARLALNVSSTRLILTDGYAGKVIDAFGGFVIGSSVLVGLVVFLILIVIQFVVITNGAGRVAEVAARFTLDAMPGKQMAIDADLTSGLIDEDEARRRRARIATEADFYGAMDGAAKFVKGDAIASIVIVAINLFGGLAIGMGTIGLSLDQAVDTFSRLSVGDGLVSQIPALLLSISTGLLVTRVGTREDISHDLGAQLLGDAGALRIAGIAVGGMAVLPGLPAAPFLVLAALLLAAPGAERREAPSEEPAPPTVATDPDDPEAIVGRMRVEPLELHLSYDILDLIDTQAGGDLLERVRALRRQIAMELGIVMPMVRTRDDVTLPAGTYSILLRGTEVGRGEAPRDMVMALPVSDSDDLGGLGGREATEPVFGLKAFWLPAGARSAAAATGATVVDRSSVVVTHLAEAVRSSAADLLSRQDVQLLLEGLRYDEPILANEVGSETLPLGVFHAVLRQLLAERVSIRDLAPIVEAAATRSAETRSIEALAAAARVAVGRAIVARIAPGGALAVLTLDPPFEVELHESLRELDGAVHLALDPARLDGLRRDCEDGMHRAAVQKLPAAVVCGQPLRRPLQRTFGGMGLELPVLAYPELAPDIQLTPTGVIGRAHVDA